MTDATEPEAVHRLRNEIKSLRREVAVREATITLADGTYQGTRDVAAEYKVRMETAEANVRAQAERANQFAEMLAEMSGYSDRLTQIADALGAKWEGDDETGRWIVTIPGVERRIALDFFLRQYEDFAKLANERTPMPGAIGRDEEGADIYFVLDRSGKVAKYMTGDVVQKVDTKQRGHVISLEDYKRLTGEDWIGDPYWVPVLREKEDVAEGWNTLGIHNFPAAKSGDIIGLDGKPGADPGDVYVVVDPLGVTITYKAGDYLIQNDADVAGRVCPHEEWRKHAGREWVDTPDEIPVIEFRDAGETSEVTSWKVGTFAYVGPEDLDEIGDDPTDKEPE